MISVTTKMLAKNVLWVIASRACSEYCKSTRFLPEVTVANSTHIHINWENSFQGCDNVDSKSATLVIRRKGRDYTYLDPPESMPVNFDDQEVDVEADPCLQHTDIKLELKYGRYYPQKFCFKLRTILQLSRHNILHKLSTSVSLLRTVAGASTRQNLQEREWAVLDP